MGKSDHPAFGDTSIWTEADHAAANAEREAELAALREEKWSEHEPEPYSRDYNTGYMDGLEDAYATQARMAAARRAGQRRAFRLAVAGAAAWLLGCAVGDTLTSLVRWVDEP